MTKTDLSKIKIGVQANITQTNLNQVPILEALEHIYTSQKLKDKTAKLRAAKTEDEYKAIKNTLPVMVISSGSTVRKQQDDDEHTGFIFADIDKCGTDENPKTLVEAIAIVEDMREDHPYIGPYFISPGGNGLKVVCAVEPDMDKHFLSYIAVKSLFKGYGLNTDDKAASKKHCCFMSYDGNAKKTLIDQLKKWDGSRIKPAEPKPVKKYVVPVREYADEMTDLDKIELCLPYIHPDDDYDRWYQVGMVIKDAGGDVSMWERWSAGGQLFKPGECERKWKSFGGRGGVGIGSVIEWAKAGNGGVNPVTKAKNSQPAQPAVTADDFDVIDETPPHADADDHADDRGGIDAYHCKGKYYIRDSTGTRYIAVSDTDLTRQLRMQGYSAKGADGEMSAVDKIKAKVVLENTVDATGTLAGRSIGMRDSEGTGMRYLVTRKNSRVQAKEGNWDNLRRILEAQYGEDQLRYFYSWLHRARYQLEKEEFMQGHALTISGKVGGGKSLVIANVIKPLLGQVADAYQYLCKDNQFNGDLIGAEMLLIDDKPLSRKMEERRIFGNQIKSIVATSRDVRCHRKGADGFNVNPLWRIVIAINDTEQDLGAMPPLGEGDEDTIGDKVLMLKCFTSPLPFTGDKDQFAKLGKMIADDLPAFAYFIDNYKIPGEIKTGTCRFGFDEFHHPELLEVLNQNSNERTLMSATMSAFFGDEFRVDILTCTTTGRRYWQGTAKDWSDALLSSKAIPHRVKNTVEGELAFGDSAIKAGVKIKAMAAISAGRVTSRHTKRGNMWCIYESANDENENENEPF